MSWKQYFLDQARSDFNMFRRLEDDTSVERCHMLHYLQMATEKFAKAALSDGNQPQWTHKALVRFIQTAGAMPKARIYKIASGATSNQQNLAYMRSLKSIAQEIEALSPDGSPHPNPEYPWEANGVIYSPLNHNFSCLSSENMISFIKLTKFIEKCLEAGLV